MRHFMMYKWYNNTLSYQKVHYNDTFSNINGCKALKMSANWKYISNLT